MNAIGFNKASTLKIVRLVMQETGTYNTQYNRPYTTTMDGGTLNALTDRVMQSPTKRIDSSMLSGLTGCFIKPQANFESEVGIIAGWNERRIRFLLEIECNYATGGSTVQYIQGYTSFAGVSNNASIAPDMVFYVNSVIQTRKTQRYTPLGAQVMENVIENSHVLANNNWQNMYQPGQQRLLRPQDIFSTMSLSHLPGNYEGNGVGSVFDSRSTLRGEAQKSRRSNGLPSVYASSIIDSYATSTDMLDFAQDEMQLLDRSRGNVMEAIAATDPFLSALTSIHGKVVNNKFSYSDLQALDPNVVHVTNFAITGNTQRTNLHSAGLTANWNGSDRVTQAATILSQAVPAIMMDLMINQIVFQSSNYDLTGAMNTVIVSGRSFSNMDLSRNYELFKQRLEHEILNDLTFNNSESYAIEMRVDLLGETWLSIALGDNASYDFVTPSFCDNLFVPVITSNPENVTQIVGDFESLTQNIKEAMGQNYNVTASQILTTV